LSYTTILNDSILAAPTDRIGPTGNHHFFEYCPHKRLINHLTHSRKGLPAPNRVSTDLRPERGCEHSLTTKKNEHPGELHHRPAGQLRSIKAACYASNH